MEPGAKQEQAEAWKRRWQRVAEKEVEELRNTPVEVKLAQLSALMASLDALGMREALEAEEAEVRARWLQLKRAYSEHA